jgi:hypothetical protein
MYILFVCLPPLLRRVKVVPKKEKLCPDNKKKQGVCHTMALPFTLLKSILRQKKNYENPNSSAHKNIPNLQQKKNPLKETKILQDIITL